jgi:ATP-dependent 26S proteasome regulatory subunit
MDITSSHAHRHSEKDFSRKFSTYVDSGAGIIHVRTHEIIRATVAIRKQVIIDGGTVKEWDIVNGFRQFTKDNVDNLIVEGDGNIDIGSAFSSPLDHLRNPTGEGVCYFVYVNPHVFMENNPTLMQLLLMYSHALPSTNAVVVLVTPDAPLPTEVESNILSIAFEPPGLGELQASLSCILEGVSGDFDGGVTLSEEDIEKVCYVGAGMSKNHFEMYAALSIVEAARDGKDTVTCQEIIDGVSIGKTDIVNSNDILELYPSTDIKNVGGLENLKEWVAKRRDCYSDDAKDFGIEAPKGVVLVGPPGCLRGDAEVIYRRGVRNSGRSIRLDDLYEKFNGIPSPNKGWDTTMPTYLHSLDPDGIMFYNRVISVTKAGKKPVMKLSLVSGESLVLTGTHPVGIPGGRYVPVEGLKAGDHVLLRGSMKPQATGGRKLDARPPRRVENVKYHPYGSPHEDSEYYAYKRIAYARLVVEAHMNGLPVDEYVHALKHNATMSAGFTFLPPEMEVHHVNEDTLDDELSNLMVLDKPEHAREHSKLENFTVEYVRIGEVASVEDAGSVMTYDIQMDMPANNFVANGILVHNTGKSLVAKAISSELGVPLVRLDFGRVFNSLVGASEQRMRTALKMVESMSPCVLFCDEIDKGLGGIGGSGDSGTSNRVLGSFLTWLNDCTHPVFTMVTANNVTGLPPEMLRRGRFDAIFSTSMPTPTERREVLRIHLKLRGRDIKDFPADEVTEVVNLSDGYVPAEIESAVKDALVDAYSEQEEMTMAHVRKALITMVPLSKAFARQIQEMNEWAKANATPAGKDTSTPVSTGNARRVSTRKRG